MYLFLPDPEVVKNDIHEVAPDADVAHGAMRCAAVGDAVRVLLHHNKKTNNSAVIFIYTRRLYEKRRRPCAYAQFISRTISLVI